MALPNVFANVTQLNTPELDENFDALGDSVVIRCTATGTNTIVLTPAADQPTITSYITGAIFTFVAAATNSTTATIDVSGVGAKNTYKNAGATATVAGDFQVGGTYAVVYNAALNGAAGGFVLLNAAPTTGAAGAIQAQFKNLVILPTSNTLCSVTADAVAVSDTTTSFTTLLSVSLSISTGTIGANGIATGDGLSASTWYYVYVIYNPSSVTTAGLISKNQPAPTALPAGFTQYARVGAIRMSAGSFIQRTIQRDYRAQYVVNATTPTAFIPFPGNAYGAGPATIAVSTLVPATAAEIFIVAQSSGAGAVGIGANATVAASAGLFPLGTNASSGFFSGSLVLESTNINAAGSVGFSAWCVGWIDNL